MFDQLIIMYVAVPPYEIFLILNILHLKNGFYVIKEFPEIKMHSNNYFSTLKRRNNYLIATCLPSLFVLNHIAIFLTHMKRCCNLYNQ